MIYSRCLYQILIAANKTARSAYPTTRGRISYLIQYACHQMGSKLIKIKIGAGHVVFLVDINIEISVVEFISRLKSLTSECITGKGDHNDYWMEGYRLLPISPEDKQTCAMFIEQFQFRERDVQVQDEMKEYILAYKTCADQQKISHTTVYHIILITSRARLLIPPKHKKLLCDLVRDSVNALGGDAVACSAMRNHIHLLCNIATTTPLSVFIDRLEATLTTSINSNEHLRKMDGLSDDVLVYTVSKDHLQQEIVNVLDQENVHWHCRLINEMSYIYQKMEITYVISLQ